MVKTMGEGSRAMPLNLQYAGVLELIEPYVANARTESRAFLAWYLENIYRLEPTEAQDAVTDGSDDKGIDGIYVNHASQTIDIFQSRLTQTERAVGSGLVTTLNGTLQQLAPEEAIDNLAATTRNVELANRIVDEGVAQLVRNGYIPRGIVVTNGTIDPSATDYIERANANIVNYDRAKINATYVPAEHLPVPNTPVDFDITGYDVSEYSVAGIRMIVAPISATELVKMDGIESGTLFDHNVRQGLGRTNVNKDIVKGIRNQSQHRNFLLYHNGATIVANKVTVTDDQLSLNGYVVVNGCQSLTAFWDNRSHLSEDLRVLVRVIELEHDSPLMDEITRNSNNQNGIKARDFQSNSAIQLRLRAEFIQTFGSDISYSISRGERSSSSEIIDNEAAARILLAFDVKQPWTCHQTYKLFDDLHSDIFARPEVNAARIVALVDAFNVIESKIGLISYELMSKYALTKYFFMLLLREALELDEKGKEFILDPRPFIIDPAHRAALKTAVGKVLEDLAVDLNAEIEDRLESADSFDYKSELKSPNAVRSLRTAVLSPYQKAIARGRASGFSSHWREAINNED